jgi:hypothetical protein
MDGDRAARRRTVRLAFAHPPPDARALPVRANLSAVTAHGDCLWLGTDEGTVLDRLTADGCNRYARHATFDLRQYLELPVEGPEIDIEGLAIEGDHLWLVGSHARTRDKARPEEDGDKAAIRALADVDPNPNRWTLARIPLAAWNGTGQELARALPGRRAGVAQLAASSKRSALLEALADDRHLKRFLKLPAKENGFDIEGIAVTGERVFLGLRGPVLRGWAVILELKLEAVGGELRLCSVGRKGRCYRKHFLALEGGGIRDLRCMGDDLLILAGPTMALDGIARVHRWTPPSGKADTITSEQGCPALFEIPCTRGGDRAEGMVLLGDPPALLVVYDSPAPARQHGEGEVDADLFALPG